MSETKTYKDLAEELDGVLSELQSIGIDVDEATELHKKGIELVRMMEKHLKATENKMTKINKD